MSGVKEIEAAIRPLPPKKREQPVDDSPSILPGLKGNAEWPRIIADPRSRPALPAPAGKIASMAC